MRTVGVSGVNVMKDVADEFNQAFPAGIDTRFKEVSIVEIGFMGSPAASRPRC